MGGFLVAVDPKHPTPIYVQLDQGIRAAIATGRLAVGAQLPTVRQLAVDLRVNANTVARVYADVDRSLWPAAEQSVRSQLEYLERG